MYYKIKNEVLFRKYKTHGYLTDNSQYGYRMLNDTQQILGEKYVSASGAVMLGMLSKSPRSLDDIVKELSHFFVGVDYETLQQDTAEFFDLFVEEGFLLRGETIDSCRNQITYNSPEAGKGNHVQSTTSESDCPNVEISPNDFLRSIHIEVANACNERCVHCYIPHQCKKNVMESSLFYQIIEEGRRMNIIHVTLSGGEPLLHKDIISFMKRCRELELSVNILSNLTL